MSATPYSRASRPRRRGREEPGDVIVTALTAQVLICAAILLLAVVAKKVDEPAYRAVKSQYTALVTQSVVEQDAQDLLSQGEGALKGAFSAIERYLASLLSRFSGQPQELPQEEIVDPSQPGSEFPAEPATPADEQADPQNEGGFSFDYLAPRDAADASALGQGGANPVSGDILSQTPMPIPTNATYAPVMLAGKVQPPVTGVITSDFSYRDHPVSGDADFHNGMDIAAEEGRDILAALPGEVVETGWSDIYGNYIILQHATNLRTFYGHCSEIIAEEGMAVRQGERIAKVGDTGVTTGPHLHFSVIVEGKFTDPYWILKDNIKLVDQP